MLPADVLHSFGGVLWPPAPLPRPIPTERPLAAAPTQSTPARVWWVARPAAAGLVVAFDRRRRSSHDDGGEEGSAGAAHAQHASCPQRARHAPWTHSHAHRLTTIDTPLFHTTRQAPQRFLLVGRRASAWLLGGVCGIDRPPRIVRRGSRASRSYIAGSHGHHADTRQRAEPWCVPPLLLVRVVAGWLIPLLLPWSLLPIGRRMMDA